MSNFSIYILIGFTLGSLPRILWNPNFNTAFTRPRHLSLSLTRLIQSMSLIPLLEYVTKWGFSCLMFQGAYRYMNPWTTRAEIDTSLRAEFETTTLAQESQGRITQITRAVPGVGLNSLTEQKILQQPLRHMGGIQAYLHSFSTSALGGCEWLTSGSGRFIPKKKTRNSLKKEAG